MEPLNHPRPLGVRWTIGDVSAEGFEALQLSMWGAWRLFGDEARYAVCVNSIDLQHARELTGEVPDAIEWIDATELLPSWLVAHFDAGMAEGVGWKFAPIRLFPDRFELALDNDCILWRAPAAIETALNAPDPSCVIAEDVRAHFGQFADLCTEARNSGIRGTPAEFDLERALRGVLQSRSCLLQTEADEQGLQVLAVSTRGEALVVRTDEVTICSPFHPHTPHLGSCGAHFVGLNARDLGWRYNDRLASEVRREHWRSQKDALRALVGLTDGGGAASVDTDSARTRD